MGLEDKIDKILDKLEENEKRLDSLEKQVSHSGIKTQSPLMEEEKKEVGALSNEEDKMAMILNKLEATERRLEALKKGGGDGSKEPSGNGGSFFNKHNDFLRVQNKWLVLIFVAVLAVMAFLVYTYAFAGVSGSSVLAPTLNAGASGQFFLGPTGSQLGTTYTKGLSNLGSQLAKVGQEQLSGSIVKQPYGCQGSSFLANKTVCPSGYAPSPGYYILEFGSNYDVIPIKVPSNLSAPSVSEGGKPTFVYMGAQGCPFCAQMRWALAVALSQFGNFSRLYYDRSATNDWNVPTLMFNFSKPIFNVSTHQNPFKGAPYGDSFPTPFYEGAYYASKYINFEPADEAGGSFIINVTGLSQLNSHVFFNAFTAGTRGYNGSSADGFGITNMAVGGVPFFDINNQYVFDGSILNAGTILDSSIGSTYPQYSTHQGILSSIQNPASGSFGETVLGAANILTAQVCEVINNTAPVCSLSYISGLEKMLAPLSAVQA